MTQAFVRYRCDSRTCYGLLEGQTIHELLGRPFEEVALAGRTVPLGSVHLLPPCEPTKIIAIGRNYRSHLGGRPAPEAPGLFAKFPNCLIGAGDDIVFPPGAEDVHYEGEMVVVIGRRARLVPPGASPSFVFGVTAGNDVSERRWQAHDLQWLRAKSSDTFGPLGPAIVRGLDYNDLLLETRVNGEVRQSQRTRDLLFDVDALVCYITQVITLEPGDLIFTGTPGTTQALAPGDLVEVALEGVGVLSNRVAVAA